MKKRILPLALIAAGGVLSYIPLVQALSPKPQQDPAIDQAGDTLPLTQEATEQAILPDEPLLSTPTPEPMPDLSQVPVQALPSGGIAQPSGPTVDEKRKASEAFRAAKTEAEEQPTLDDIKLRAFAADTERQKRALLREYYQAISDYVIKTSPALKDQAQTWAYVQLNRLGRKRTEPDYVPPTQPAAVVAATSGNAEAKPTPEKKNGFLPALGD